VHFRGFCPILGSDGSEGIRPLSWGLGAILAWSVVVVRGSGVIDKSFLIMALACAMAPFLGVGIYLMVNLF